MWESKKRLTHDCPLPDYLTPHGRWVVLFLGENLFSGYPSHRPKRFLTEKTFPHGKNLHPLKGPKARIVFE